MLMKLSFKERKAKCRTCSKHQ